MIIALFPNIQKRISRNLAFGIRQYMTARGATVVVEDEAAEALECTPLSSVAPESVSVSISMGGDGTILQLVHRHPELEAPVLGINLGHLGFMADVPISDIYPSLQELLDGNYRVEERLMAVGMTMSGEQCYAVNELAVHRSRNPSLIGLAIHIDGIYLNTLEADGVIVATPSGSTAYSLAAGGPILTPELEAFVLTPISAHTISNRPLVFLPDHEVQIQYLSNYEPIEIAFDGIARHTMATGEVLRVRKAPKKFRLIALQRHDYFSTLRTKLGLAGMLRQ